MLIETVNKRNASADPTWGKGIKSYQVYKTEALVASARSQSGPKLNSMTPYNCRPPFQGLAISQILF